MDKFTDWFNGLSAREQTLLQVAAPAALAIALLIIITHSYQGVTQARQQHQQLLSDYQWLRSEAPAINRWHGEFGKRDLGKLSEAAELGGVLNAGLKKYRIKGAVTPLQDGQWQLAINPSDGNRVLAYIEAAVGTGASPVQVKLTRADSKGKVRGRIVFAPLLKG